MKTKVLSLVLFLVFNGLLIVSAQNAAPPPLECGSILEEELSDSNRFGDYTIQASAGTVITVVVEPIGDSFNPYLVLQNSVGTEILQFNSSPGGENEVFGDYTISSSNSILLIYAGSPNDTRTGYSNFNNATYYGAYIISLACTLRDGTYIAAGSTVNIEDLPVRPQTPVLGFPGLPPVDFSDGITIPLTPDTPNTGSINPGFDSVFGFTFEGIEGATVSLEFNRLSGNVALGLAVISDSNQIAYMSALVSSTAMSLTFTLPSAGQYTIGVFRIDLVPLPSPEATSFTVEATMGE